MQPPAHYNRQSDKVALECRYWNGRPPLCRLVQVGIRLDYQSEHRVLVGHLGAHGPSY